MPRLLLPAGAKDDRRDPLTLADVLRTDRRFFRKLDAPTREVVELHEWTRIANTLTSERTRLLNRLRQQLWVSNCGPSLARPRGRVA